MVLRAVLILETCCMGGDSYGGLLPYVTLTQRPPPPPQHATPPPPLQHSTPLVHPPSTRWFWSPSRPAFPILPHHAHHLTPAQRRRPPPITMLASLTSWVLPKPTRGLFESKSRDVSRLCSFLMVAETLVFAQKSLINCF